MAGCTGVLLSSCVHLSLCCLSLSRENISAYQLLESLNMPQLHSGAQTKFDAMGVLSGERSLTLSLKEKHR